MVSPVPARAAAAVPPNSKTSRGCFSAIWRWQNGRQTAISEVLGLRFPGGRQVTMLVM